MLINLTKTICFVDTSISSTDINKLQTSINEIRINQNYELFQKLNNFQEIDFSGKWYYSLEQHYRFPYEVDSFGNCIEENNLDLETVFDKIIIIQYMVM